MRIVPSFLATLSVLAIHCTIGIADDRHLTDPADAADSRARLDSREANDAESSVAEAAQVYRNLVKEGKVPPSVLREARCVAVFPKVVTAALAVGGIHGDGVAFCKNSSGDWGNPVFLDMSGGSIGLQAGIKTSDVVLYMTGEDARSMVQQESIQLGGDVSVTAGSFNESFEAPRRGVVAYATTTGAFAGAALTGVNMSHDEDEQRAFYGTYDKDSIFEGRMPEQVAKSVDELRDLLPKA